MYVHHISYMIETLFWSSCLPVPLAVVDVNDSVTLPESPEPWIQSSSSHASFAIVSSFLCGVVGCLVGGTYTGVIKSSPLPDSNGGVHSSSSSPRQPEPAPENIRSSASPG